MIEGPPVLLLTRRSAVTATGLGAVANATDSSQDSDSCYRGSGPVLSGKRGLRHGIERWGGLGPVALANLDAFGA